MSQAWATRYYAESKGGASSIDTVCVSLNIGGFELRYDEFYEMFRLEIAKGAEIAFEVDAVKIKAAECQVPR